MRARPLLMLKYDRDASGDFTVEEVRHIIADMLKKGRKVRTLWKLMACLATLWLISLASILLMTLLANDLSKDFRPAGSGDTALVTQDGDVVQVDAVSSHATLLDLPLLDYATLNKMQSITFVTYEGMLHFNVVGYKRHTDAESLTLYVDRYADGSTIEIGADAAYFVTGVERTKIVVDADESDARRLAAGDEGLGRCLTNGACLYSSDALMTLRTSAAARRRNLASRNGGGGDASGARRRGGRFHPVADVAQRDEDAVEVESDEVWRKSQPSSRRRLVVFRLRASVSLSRCRAVVRAVFFRPERVGGASRGSHRVCARAGPRAPPPLSFRVVSCLRRASSSST